MQTKGFHTTQSTLESDVCRHQILMSKVDSHTERVEIFIMAVDPGIQIKIFMMILN